MGHSLKNKGLNGNPYQVPQWKTSLEIRGLNCVGEKNNLNVSIFGTKVQGVNFVQIESSLYYWKALKAWI
jgi:hypothetical protein